MKSVAVIRALIEKDVRLHWGAILIYAVSSAAYPLILYTGIRKVAQTSAPHTVLGTFPIVPIAMMAVVFFPLLAGQWLVGTEKTKRTLFTLRMLPITPGEIAVGKTCAALVATAFVALGCVLSTQWVIYVMPNLAGQWSVRGIVCAITLIIVLVQVSLVLQLKLNQRIAFQIPFAVFILARPVWQLVGAAFPNVSYYISIYGLRSVGPLLCLLIPILHVSMARCIARSDWSRPTNE